MPWARASELDRILACQGSLLLPGVSAKSDGVKEAAAWGTMVHHWKRTGEVKPVEGYEKHGPLFLKRKDLPKDAGGWPDREEMWPSSGKHEITVALDCEGGGVAWTEEQDQAKIDAWKAALPDNWATGTMDYEDELFGLPWVDDLKTGSAMFLTLPADAAQTKFYTLVKHKLELERPPEAHTSISHWPRYPIEHGLKRYWHVFTRDDLYAFEQQLRAAYRNWRRMQTLKTGLVVEDFNKGEHCVFCPGKDNCPVV